MPEVRINMVYALSGAKSPKEVAAVKGRITAVDGFPRASGLPGFGVSDHMARLILEIRKYDPDVNAGINFRCDGELIEVVKAYGKEKGLRFGWIDRTKEPPEVQLKDGASMPWKVRYLAETYGNVPRLFYEGEGWGKEPLFVVTGKEALEVTKMAIDIGKRYHLRKRG